MHLIFPILKWSREDNGEAKTYVVGIGSSLEGVQATAAARRQQPAVSSLKLEAEKGGEKPSVGSSPVKIGDLNSHR